MDIYTEKNFTATDKRRVFEEIFKPAPLKEKAEVLEDCIKTDKEELIDCIKRAREEWLSAQSNFEYADQKEIIDYYTYKMKASEIIYQYYLKKAKELGIKNNISIEEI